MSDWISGTCAHGASSLQTGKRVEELVHKSLTDRGVNVEWISNDKESFYCGYDMVVSGKRVEIKSNEYIDNRGKIVIEISDKTPQKRRSKWMDGTAHIFLFVERSTGRTLLYDASLLTGILDSISQNTGMIRTYNGAHCLHVDAINPALISETRL